MMRSVGVLRVNQVKLLSSMQIHINTDRNINGREALSNHISGEIEQALSRFNEHITRVEVHLSDENSDKKGGKDGLKCVMEARLEGRHPLAVTHQATLIDSEYTLLLWGSSRPVISSQLPGKVYLW